MNTQPSSVGDPDEPHDIDGDMDNIDKELTAWLKQTRRLVVACSSFLTLPTISFSAGTAPDHKRLIGKLAIDLAVLDYAKRMVRVFPDSSLKEPLLMTSTGVGSRLLRSRTSRD
jgi:hypothetical protein